MLDLISKDKSNMQSSIMDTNKSEIIVVDLTPFHRNVIVFVLGYCTLHVIIVVCAVLLNKPRFWVFISHTFSYQLGLTAYSICAIVSNAQSVVS